MPKVAVYDIAHNQVGEIELNNEIFGVEVNGALLHQVVVMQLANQRLGTHATKTRAMVRGGGRKPWRQKGTGHARSGSSRSPLWKGGGVVFGPHPRSYAFSMPKKQHRLAIKCALSDKVNEASIFVLDSFVMDEYKTKTIVKLLSDFGVEEKSLIITAGDTNTIERSCGNIPGVKASTIREYEVLTADGEEKKIYDMGLNVYDIMNSGKLFITKDAIAKIEEVLA